MFLWVFQSYIFFPAVLESLLLRQQWFNVVMTAKVSIIIVSWISVFLKRPNSFLACCADHVLSFLTELNLIVKLIKKSTHSGKLVRSFAIRQVNFKRKFLNYFYTVLFLVQFQPSVDLYKNRPEIFWMKLKNYAAYLFSVYVCVVSLLAM